MIALGLTHSLADLGPPFVVDTVGVISAEAEAAATPRAFLALQLKAHQALDVFVPFAGHAAPNSDMAHAWIRRNDAIVRQALRDMRGKEQATVIARPVDAVSRAATGTDWLAGRVKAHRARGELSQCLAKLGQPYVVEHRMAEKSDAVVAHYLSNKTRTSALLDNLRQTLSERQPDGWRFTLSGGWPPGAFCAEMWHAKEPA